MINELDRVILTENITDKKLEKGYIGTVVDVDPGGKGYIVEFMTLKGQTIAVASLSTNQVREITNVDIARADHIAAE
ncbi:MAG: DUF4926 domain-containing protein [Hyphomicrobiaceae bacterium]|nr:DUF4926 domain-containing protein [Hyphomicrobiaceae bacterium]